MRRHICINHLSYSHQLRDLEMIQEVHRCPYYMSIHLPIAWRLLWLCPLPKDWQWRCRGFLWLECVQCLPKVIKPRAVICHALHVVPCRCYPIQHSIKRYAVPSVRIDHMIELQAFALVAGYRGYGSRYKVRRPVAESMNEFRRTFGPDAVFACLCCCLFPLVAIAAKPRKQAL